MNNQISYTEVTRLHSLAHTSRKMSPVEGAALWPPVRRRPVAACRLHQAASKKSGTSPVLSAGHHEQLSPDSHGASFQKFIAHSSNGNASRTPSCNQN